MEDVDPLLDQQVLAVSEAQRKAHALIDRKTHGFSIFRLLGARDYLLRAWVRESDRQTLREVLDTYEVERAGVSEPFDPVLRWPATPPNARLPLERPTELLGLIYDLAMRPGIDSIERTAMRAGLIVGRSKNVRDSIRPAARRAIRAISRINYAKDIKIEQADAIGAELFAKSKKLRGLREVEVFANPGARGAPAQFVVIAELDRFHLFVTSFSSSARRCRSTSRILVDEHRYVIVLTSRWMITRRSSPTTNAYFSNSVGGGVHIRDRNGSV